MQEEFIIVDGVQIPNPEYKKAAQDGELDVDYKVKFSESSKEAQRLLDENKRLAKELEEKDEPRKTNESLFPGFEELDEDAKENLINYTRTVENNVTERLHKDPAIAFARQQYNQKKWNDAFVKVAESLPDLNSVKAEFMSKYYNQNNVPDNIEEILTTIGKGYLFDKAKEIGAREVEEKKNRIDLEKGSGGDKGSTSGRTLEEWQRMARENPAKFAKESKQFQEDLASGKLKE